MKIEIYFYVNFPFRAIFVVVVVDASSYKLFR